MQPIFLLHGFIGYRTFLLWELFRGVTDALKEEGVTAYRPLLHPTATIEERGKQLQEIINQTVGENEPIHIIAHSMGGLDARYFISPNGLQQGHRVITLTTISTPHYGSPVARYIPKLLTYSVSTASWFGKRLPLHQDTRNFLKGISEYRWTALPQLCPEYINNVFNPQIIDDSRVHYASYGGKIKPPKYIWTNFPRSVSWRIINHYDGDNDGLVSVKSAQWGEFKGILPADHGEQIGLKIYPWQKSTFDHIAFIKGIVKDIKTFE